MQKQIIFQLVSNTILRRLFLLGWFLFLSLFWCLFILKDCMSRCIKSKQIWTKRVGWFPSFQFQSPDWSSWKEMFIHRCDSNWDVLFRFTPLPEGVIHFHNPSWYWKSISSISPFLVRNHPQNRVNGLNPPFLLKKKPFLLKKNIPFHVY